MSTTRRLWIALGLLLGVTFTVLLGMGREIHRNLEYRRMASAQWSLKTGNRNGPQIRSVQREFSACRAQHRLRSAIFGRRNNSGNRRSRCASLE